jgi:WD40 repeat protein
VSLKVSQPRRGAFISYARADGESAARALHGRLGVDAPDIPAWLDRYDIEGGVGWWNQIEQELERAEFLLLVMTPAAIRSENMRNEWRSARQRGVCVYPVKGVPDPQLDYASLPNWMRKVHFYDLEVEWEKLLAHLRRGCRVTRVTFMAPPLPASFVARPHQSAQLLALLATSDGRDPAGVAVTLRGPGGFGKTTLAAALCHDDRILDAFDDGILWVTLGQNPNLLNELVKLYAALTGERPGFVDVEDATRELALRLEGKNCLIVIDDVWSSADLRPFLQGGNGCARLITTRRFDLASDARRVDVDRMSAAEALELLLARAGSTPPDTEPCERLIERLGEWPLPIMLAGSAMRQRIERGDTIAGAVAYLSRALDKRGIAAFDRQPTAAREDAVVRTVGASLDLLGPDDQRRCAELAVLQPGAAHPLTALATLWQLDDLDTEDLARKLDDLALVTFDLRSATLRMHDVLRGFFAERLADAAAVHQRLLDGWGDPYSLSDPYEWRALAYHMRRAGRQEALRALLLNPRWLDAKLRATDIHALIVDFEQTEGDGVLELLRDALRLAAPSLAADPAQLQTQLTGRLQLRDEPDIVALRAAVRDTAAGPWLQLLHPTLDTPGGFLFMTLVGHNAAVTSLAVDEEWRWLLSGSNDETIRVWDAGNGQLIRILDHAQAAFRRSVRAEVWELAVSHDGRMALAGAADGFIYVWDVVHGTPQPRFSREAGRAISAVALSADGRIAVSASRDRTLRVWNAPARVLACVLSGHQDEVTSVAISAAGTRAASGSDDATVRLWNVSTGALERTLEGHTAGVNAVALSADGCHVLSGSSDRTVKLWEASTGSCVRTLPRHDASVTSVALAAAGWRALVGTSDRHVTLWDLHNGHLLARLDGHSDSVTAVCIDDAGIRAATCSNDTTVKLWQLDDLRAARSTDADAGVVQVVVFSPDGRLCASASDDGPVTIREVGSGRVVRRIDATPAPARALAFTPDSSCILSAGGGQYWLWRIDTGEGTWMPVRHAAPVDCSALSAVARYLTTSCADRFVYIWDVPSGGLIDRFGTRRLFTHVITPAPKRQTLPDTEECRDTYLAGESVYDVVVASMSGDGAYAIFSARKHDPDGACLLVLNIGTGEIQSMAVPQKVPVKAFTIDADATRLLWARADHTIELWDLHRNERITTMRGHTDKVEAVRLSCDGRRAFSCGRDRTVRVWFVDTGEQIAAFTADAPLRGLAVAPADDVIAAGDVAGRVHLLRLVSPSPSVSPVRDTGSAEPEF